MAGRYKVAPAAERKYRGRTYHSKAERMWAETLELDPTVHWWSPQITFHLTEDDTYTADFFVVLADRRSIEIHEVKGVETPEWKRVKRLWKKYGPFRLRIITRNATVKVIDGGAM